MAAFGEDMDESKEIQEKSDKFNKKHKKKIDDALGGLWDEATMEEMSKERWEKLKQEK